MAVVTLTPFNTVVLASGAVDQLVGPSPGRYDLTILNVGNGAIYIKNANTVAAGDPNSFELPAGLAVTIVIFGPDGIWITAGAGASDTVSVLLQPRGQ